MTFGNAGNGTHKAIIDAVNAHASNRPRALQTAVGASGVGTTCQRQLAYRMLNAAKVRGDRDPGWLAQIGTAVHAYLETIFAGNDRYLTEQPVTVTYKGMEIPGTVDLYDKETNTVVDFKVVGEDTLAKARRNDISAQYRIQVALYGIGLRQAGHQVSTVGILFLPRNKELSESIFFSEPLDTTIVEAYLQRYAATRQLTTSLGIEALDSMLTADAPCVWCDWYNPNSKNIANGCTGAILNRREQKQ